jgi:hypothetical protein
VVLAMSSQVEGSIETRPAKSALQEKIKDHPLQIIASVCVIRGMSGRPFTSCRPEVSRGAGPGFYGMSG